ncbi:MAG: hypothetical protein RLZ72_1147 [Actinomycetota bacterium]|jgi:hypothetical protein
MRGKILFALGLGVGYVFGTRAGRARYNQMKSAALKVWNDPRVQEQVSVATEFVKDKAPEVVDFVSANAKKVAAKVDEARGVKPTPAATPKPKASTKTTTATESEPAGK